MPIIKSAIKRMHQTLTRRARNITTKRNMRSAIKDFTADKTAENLSKAQSKIDTAVKKKQMNKNTAARKKAQLARLAKEASSAPAKKAATPKKATVAKKPATKKPAAKKTTAKKEA